MFINLALFKPSKNFSNLELIHNFRFLQIKPIKFKKEKKKKKTLTKLSPEKEIINMD